MSSKATDDAKMQAKGRGAVGGGLQQACGGWWEGGERCCPSKLRGQGCCQTWVARVVRACRWHPLLLLRLVVLTEMHVQEGETMMFALFMVMDRGLWIHML